MHRFAELRGMNSERPIRKLDKGEFIRIHNRTIRPFISVPIMVSARLKRQRFWICIRDGSMCPVAALAMTCECWQSLGMSVEKVELLENRVTGRLAGRLAGRVQSRNVPWAVQVVSWLDLVDLCRELDDGLNAAGLPAEESLATHEAVVSLAIGCGSWLLHQIRVNQADLSPSGQTLNG
jgi:hypothetical protein